MARAAVATAPRVPAASAHARAVDAGVQRPIGVSRDHVDPCGQRPRVNRPGRPSPRRLRSAAASQRLRATTGIAPAPRRLRPRRRSRETRTAADCAERSSDSASRQPVVVCPDDAEAIAAWTPIGLSGAGVARDRSAASPRCSCRGSGRSSRGPAAHRASSAASPRAGEHPRGARQEPRRRATCRPWPTSCAARAGAPRSRLADPAWRRRRAGGWGVIDDVVRAWFRGPPRWRRAVPAGTPRSRRRAARPAVGARGSPARARDRRALLAIDVHHRPQCACRPSRLDVKRPAVRIPVAPECQQHVPPRARRAEPQRPAPRAPGAPRSASRQTNSATCRVGQRVGEPRPGRQRPCRDRHIALETRRAGDEHPRGPQAAAVSRRSRRSWPRLLVTASRSASANASSSGRGWSTMPRGLPCGRPRAPRSTAIARVPRPPQRSAPQARALRENGRVAHQPRGSRAGTREAAAQSRRPRRAGGLGDPVVDERLEAAGAAAVRAPHNGRTR